MKRTITLVTIGVFVFSMMLPMQRASAEVIAAWLQQDPVISRTALLQAGWPYTRGVDCDETVASADPSDRNGPQCVIATPAGKATAEGWYMGDGVQHLPLLLDRAELIPYGGLTFVGSPSAGLLKTNVPNRVAVWTLASSNELNSSYIGIYNNFLPEHLQKQGSYVQITQPPDTWVKDGAGIRVPFREDSIAFSQNGRWMVGLMDGGDYMALGDPIVLYDMQTAKMKVVGTARASYFAGDTGSPRNLAVTNDGRFIATNMQGFSTVVYDTASCSDQYEAYKAWDYDKPDPEYCSEKAIWYGWGIDTVNPGPVSTQDPGIEVPLYLRFQNNNTLSFVGVDITGFRNAREIVPQTVVAGQMTVGTAIVGPVGGEELPPIDVSAWTRPGVLALGDSYISGEGAYNYRLGLMPQYDTDSAENKCHTSLDSYPYLLGKRLDMVHASVACSGAKMEDIQTLNRQYSGQASDGIAESQQTKSYQSNILQSYIPGYIQQLKFVETYKPKTILLSVGGNDAHFKDILVRCALDAPTDSCFAKRSERKQLLQMVYNQHANLVSTYKKILEASPGTRLYVVGYPQIANKDGNCGVNVRMDAGELAFGEGLIRELNKTIENAATSVGARYVDISQALNGNRLCDQNPSAVNGVTSGNDIALGTIGNESYHPTAYGHVLIANKISRETADLTQFMPAATGAGKLAVDSENPFITGARQDNGMVRNFIFGNLAAPVVVKGAQTNLNANIGLYGAVAGQSYSVVFTSEPLQVATGTIGQDGSISSVLATPHIATGAHTLHVYTTNSQGEPLDIAQVVYVAASAEDYDGDTVVNQADACALIPNSGQDADKDGVDDACDGQTTALVPEGQPANSGGSILGPSTAKQTLNNFALAQNISATGFAYDVVFDIPQEPNTKPATSSTEEQDDKKSVVHSVSPGSKRPMRLVVAGLLMLAILMACVLQLRRHLVARRGD